MVGASNKIGDYLAAGIPILCFRTSEFEALSKQLNGVYPVGDDDDLIELLTQLKSRYSDPAARSALQDQIRTRCNYESEFGPVLTRFFSTVSL